MIMITSTYDLRKECKHENGWWVVVRFWIFRKQVFVCSDCGTVKEET